MGFRHLKLPTPHENPNFIDGPIVTKLQCPALPSGDPQSPSPEMIQSSPGEAAMSTSDTIIKHTLSRFSDDTKMSGLIDMTERQDARQRDLDKFKKWAYGPLMRYNKVKYKILHLGHSNSKYKYSLGREQIESSSEEKDLRWMKIFISPSNGLSYPRRQIISWGTSK
ncbi:hypothetical protein TURU_093271 [Turdus rufiventris]|nr:hypothetical protein TURU_093271 [Turdus rufiventris]